MAPSRATCLVDRARCADFSVSSRLEWLDTNGLGFYAMGTVSGARTRRYHGLLNGPAAPHLPTAVWLNALEETLTLGAQKFLLHTQQYSGVVTPRGYENLVEFQPSPCPQWLYRFDESSLTREVFLVEGLPAVVVRYCCSDDATLDLRPLVSGRHHHSLLAESLEAPFLAVTSATPVILHRDDAVLHLHSPSASYTPAADWYYRFEYTAERHRGLDFHEDLWSPGTFQLRLAADTWTYFLASLDSLSPDPMQLLRWREAKDTRFPVAKSLPQRLRNSAKHFVFQRPTHLSVIAGYPWFTDWGRDTFISLPGLLLANGQLNDAADVIAGFLSRRSHGLVPNRITDDGSTPEYNSIDATLWAFLAANSWREAGGDRQRLREQFFPAFLEILHTLERGTLFAIQVDPADALLSAGTMETQLTWMDARVYGVPVTPRFGKAVEINALWYNALRLTTDWAREFGDFPAERHFGQLANRAIASFTTLFWNQEKRCLYDVIRLGFRDPKVRPNQLFALSLPYPLLIRSKAEQLLQVVESELLTPFGLRTLSKLDPHFRPRFEGGPEQRDAAYHQGSVWPWLLGPYIRASLRTRGRNPQELARCRQLLDPLLASLDEGCLNQITEVYDGDAPHRPAGAPAQAWSLAEVLSLLTSELSQT